MAVRPIYGKHFCIDGLPPAPDYHDLVIQDLADGEAAFAADAVSYRELARVTIGRLAAVTTQLASLRDQHRQVVDEYREFRERVMAAPSSSWRAA